MITVKEYYNKKGRLIGRLRDDMTFIKMASKSRHYMKKHGWGIDEAVIQNLRMLGCEKIVIMECEEKEYWVSYMYDWIDDGIVLNYGHGTQRFLPPNKFIILDKDKNIINHNKYKHLISKNER